MCRCCCCCWPPSPPPPSSLLPWNRNFPNAMVHLADAWYSQLAFNDIHLYFPNPLIGQGTAKRTFVDFLMIRAVVWGRPSGRWSGKRNVTSRVSERKRCIETQRVFYDTSFCFSFPCVFLIFTIKLGACFTHGEILLQYTSILGKVTRVFI